MSAAHTPSAFPVNSANLGGPGAYPADPGMDLRDWFAGQALPAVIRICVNDTLASSGQTYERYCADQAYEMADAMLAARGQGK